MSPGPAGLESEMGHWGARAINGLIDMSKANSSKHLNILSLS